MLNIAIPLLIMGAMAQILFSMTHALRGSLQGFRETKTIMMASVIGNWGVGIPLGYVLANTNWIVEPMGIYGLWIGVLLTPLVSSALMASKLNAVLNNKFKAAFA